MVYNPVHAEWLRGKADGSSAERASASVDLNHRRLRVQIACTIGFHSFMHTQFLRTDLATALGIHSTTLLPDALSVPANLAKFENTKIIRVSFLLEVD